MSRTVLIVEDNPITRKLFRITLEGEGYSVLEAPDGKTALDLANEHDGIDLVLLDLLLPDTHGAELVHKLREITNFDSKPIVAVTGLLSKLEEARALNAGFTGYLLKPVEPSKLLETVEAYLPRGEPLAERPGRDRNILLVDDDPVGLKLQKLLLEELGFNVTAVDSAKTALNVAKNSPPDAVVTDLVMPGVNGLELAVSIRKNRKLRNIAVIVTSATYSVIEERDVRMAKQMGADSFVLRTPKLDHVIPALLEALRKKQKAQPGKNTAALLLKFNRRLVHQLEVQAARRTQELRRAALETAKLSVLTGVAEMLNKQLGLDRALEEALARTLDASGVSIGAIYLKQDNGQIRLQTHLGFPEGELEKLTDLYKDEEFLKQAFQENKSVITTPENAGQGIVGQLLKRGLAKSVVVIPLVAGDDPQGALMMASARQELVEDWLDLANAVGAQLAQAVLLSRTHMQLSESEKRIRILHEVGQNILLAPDLSSTLEKILDKVMSVDAFDLGTILLVKSDGKEVEAVASRGYRDANNVRKSPREETAGRPQYRSLIYKKTFIVENLADYDGLRTLKKEEIQSAMLIPTMAGEQALGFIQLGSRTQRKFDPEKVKVVEAIANQMGVAIQKYRLFEETQRNLERIRALHEIDLAITSTLDLRTILDFLLEKIDVFLPYPSATTVRLVNKESGLLEPVACRNLNEAVWKEGEGKTGRGLANVVFETKAALVLRNVQADPRTRDRKFFTRYGLVSYLGVPLIAKRQVLGVLNFYTKEEHEFSSEEIDFLATLAGQAAIAINNAQLYTRVESSKKELELTNQYLERSLKQLSGLYTALSPLTPSESIHEMMDGIIERLIEATGADAAQVRFWDNTSGKFVRAGQRGFPDSYFISEGTIGTGGAADWVFKTGEPIIASDIATDPRLKAKVQPKLGFYSCAMLPLRVHDQVRGIIQLSSRKMGYFDEEQKDQLMAIARQMGIALENKELFDSLQKSRDELEKANKVKDEFLSVMSHELRTPLNVVVGYTGMIRDGMLGEVNPQQAEALDKVIRRTNDQLALVNNILYATVLESENVVVDTQDFNLEDLLNQLKLDYEAPINKELSLNWDYPLGLPFIRTDSAKLKHILRNLIDNALKFTSKGSVTISAQIRQQAAGNRQQMEDRHEATGERQQEEGLLTPRAFVEFKVADTGAGIPKDALPFVFDKFRQVDSSETRLFGGVGMGLYIVKQFAELMGGTVEVESEVGKGTTFTVTLPGGQ